MGKTSSGAYQSKPNCQGVELNNTALTGAINCNTTILRARVIHHRGMRIYFEIIPAFILFAIYLFLVLRWWYRRLTIFAERYDVFERRKRAALWFPLVLVLVGVPALIILICGIIVLHTNAYIAVISFICSLIPGVVWWVCKIPHLIALGYGRQR